MPFQIVRDDITHLQVDAIVNAANEQLKRGGGVCGAIFAAAGPIELQAACDAIGHCDAGHSVATPAFALGAKHVIHTVGPLWQGGGFGEEAALRSCYASALNLAAELKDASIAFPLISAGTYGYPQNAALDVAFSEIRNFLRDHEMDVYLTLFDAESLRAGHERFARIAEYIDDRYVDANPYRRQSQANEPLAQSAPAPFEGTSAGEGEPIAEAMAPMSMAAQPTVPKRATTREGALRKLLRKLDASFSTTLLRMIDERGLKDSEVYKRANMSRQHFSKIRSNRTYQPKKQTVLALAIALQLSLDETRLLLERAGFALTHADERDVIVEYFINQGNYDIYEINLALYAFDQPLLG